MPIDPRIALGVQPLQVADPMARYSQLAGIQNAQNQNALAQYQLGSAQRTEKAQNLLADAYAQSTNPETGEIDYNKLTGLVAAGGGGAQIPAIVKSRREMEQAALTQRETAFKVEKSKNDFIAQAKRDTSQNPSDENLTAFKQDLIANPLFTAAEKTQYAANVDRILAMPVDQRRSFMASQGASASELKPTLTSQNLGKTTQIISTPAYGGSATVVPSSVQNVTMTAAQEREAADSAKRIEQDNKRIALEGRRVSVAEEGSRRDAIRLKQEGDRLGLEGRRVVVLEEEAKQKKDPVFQQSMAAAKAKGEAIAKGEVGAKQALPGVITNASIALNVIDDMIGKQAVKDSSGKVIQAATAPHPGFKDAVGATWKPGFRFIPGTDASDFQSYQDQIEGAAFLSAFESLKGGGAISEKEGAKATSAKLRMKLAQSETEYVKAAREFQEVVRTGVENARQKFGAGGVPPATGGAVFLGFE
jgi:hypothetical protein